MSSRFTKKSLVSVSGRSVKTPCSDPPALALSARIPPMRTVISGAVSVNRLARSTSWCSAGIVSPARSVVAEAVGGRLERGERVDVGLLLRGVRAPGGERNRDVVPGLRRRRLDGGAAAENDHVGERDPLAAGLRGVEVLLDPLEGPQRSGQLGRVVDLANPSAARAGCARRWRRRACRCRGRSPPTPRRSRPAGGSDSPDGEDLALQRRDVLASDQLVIDVGDGVLPQLRLGRNQRAEVPRHGSHVTMGQLVPRLGERVGELVGVLVEPSRDRARRSGRPSARGRS